MAIIKRNTELRPFYSGLLDDFFTSGMWPAGGEHHNMPALNVKEDDKQLILELRIPGMKKKDMHLEYKNGILTISGEVQEEKEEKEEKGKYLRREFSSYSFRRALELPEDKYNVAEAKAAYQDGILEITMPKNAETEKLHKTIEVK